MAQVMWNRYNREEAIREQADKPAQQVLLTKTPQDSLVQVIVRYVCVLCVLCVCCALCMLLSVYVYVPV